MLPLLTIRQTLVWIISHMLFLLWHISLYLDNLIMTGFFICVLIFDTNLSDTLFYSVAYTPRLVAQDYVAKILNPCSLLHTVYNLISAKYPTFITFIFIFEFTQYTQQCNVHVPLRICANDIHKIYVSFELRILLLYFSLQLHILSSEIPINLN